MVGRQLPFFSVLVPFWLIWAFAGWRGMMQVWPATLVCGVSFAVPQFLISNYINPWIVDIGASVIAMSCLIGFLRFWQPAELWTSPRLRQRDESASTMPPPKPPGPQASTAEVLKAWVPWGILCAVIGIWATETFRTFANGIFAPGFAIDGLHNLVQKMPPVVLSPTNEGAVFTFAFLSYTGTGILVSAILAAGFMGFSFRRFIGAYLETLKVVRFSLITIAAMLALGTLTRYSGVDATLGLAFAATGFFYPFFGTLLGWLGVALTGSDTASNVLFGGLQRVTAEQLGISPILMGAANSSGGVMGKMIDAQSIVVASTATGWYGHESSILRFVFVHSIVLASLVGVLVMLQAYVWPFSAMVVQ
jgi:lactate permease